MSRSGTPEKLSRGQLNQPKQTIASGPGSAEDDPELTLARRTLSPGRPFRVRWHGISEGRRNARRVNSPNETKYFYQDLDAGGARLNSANRYTVTFAKDATPPVNGFWSLSIYNEHHFFVANAINRFSVGTKNKDLRPNPDGSLTIYVQADEPTDPLQRANWLPAPKGDFSLYVRAYWPKAEVLDGSWTPPAVQKMN